MKNESQGEETTGYNNCLPKLPGSFIIGNSLHTFG
jgi:hypothetical protein